MKSEIKLMDFSKGSGCGCKIAPDVLQDILSSVKVNTHASLIAGPTNNEDAAVFDLLNGEYLVSTTDFFLPVVNNAFDFGRVAACNALSDIYAMGAGPIFALGILGWPLEKLPVSLAKEVMAGASDICDKAGIPLGGGHSIESSDPIFGLVVNGLVKKQNILFNNASRPGDSIFMTKKLGLGILSAAMKRGLLNDSAYHDLITCMTTLNSIGKRLAESGFVNSMTDITGFGFIGHLMEMAKGSACHAVINKESLPVFSKARELAGQFIYPDITTRNYNAYAGETLGMEDLDFLILCDPQTSGGLLFSVKNEMLSSFENLIETLSLNPYETPIKIGHWEELLTDKYISFT